MRDVAPRPTALLTIGGLVLASAGYNGAIFGAVLPVLLTDHHLALSTGYAGFIGTASVVATIFGSLAAGMLSDYVGWIWAVGAAVLGYAIGALLCALARTPDWLLLGRLVVGLGLGAFNPPAQAAVVRYSPRARQGFYFALASSAFVFGQVLAAVAALLLVPRLGYELVLLLGAGHVVVIGLLLASGPARSVIRGLSAERPVVALGRKRRLLAAPRMVLGAAHRRITVVFGIGSALCLLVAYASRTWLPSIMMKAGYATGSALVFLMVMKFGTMAGTLVGGRSADRHGYKPALILSCGCAVVGLVMVAAYPRMAIAYLMIALVGVGASGAQNQLLAYAGASYPNAVRSSGLAVINVVGLIGGSMGPVIGAVLLSGGASAPTVLLVFAAAPAIAMIVLLFAPAVPSRSGPVASTVSGSRDK